MMEIIFYPMSKKPEEDKSDNTFSKTVLIYDDFLKFVGLGYYDYEQEEWSHFGENKSLLKCWCYIPQPQNLDNEFEWELFAPKGYNKFPF